MGSSSAQGTVTHNFKRTITHPLNVHGQIIELAPSMETQQGFDFGKKQLMVDAQTRRVDFDPISISKKTSLPTFITGVADIVGLHTGQTRGSHRPNGIAD